MRHSAEQVANAFPGLLIAAERIADAVIHGGHGRRRAGPGEDFWQYRPYSPGDPVGRIDWRRSAKRNRLFIRENEWAATNTLWTFVDASAGMKFKSELSQTTKYQRAATLAIALSILAVKAGERAGVLNAPFTPGHTRSSINKIAQWYEIENLTLQQHDRDNDDSEMVFSALKQPPRFASCALFSDFLAPIEQLKRQFNQLASNGASANIVQIMDPIEETFPFKGRTRFLDTGSNANLIAGKAESLRNAYNQKLTSHRAQLKDLCKSLDWNFTLHRTDQPAHTILLHLHQLIAAKQPAQQFAQTGS